MLPLSAPDAAFLRRTRKYPAFTLCALIGSFPLSAHSISQADMDAAMEIGKGYGELIGGAISSYGKMTATREELTGKIRAARTEFWRTYPAKEGHAAAAAEFEKVLREKDFVYQSLDFMEHPQRSLAIGEGVDGGIPAYAFAAFNAWSYRIKGELNVRTHFNLLAMTPEDYVAAVSASKPQYEVYRTLRDQSEFLRKDVDLFMSFGPRTILTPQFAMEKSKWNPEFSMADGGMSFSAFESLFGSKLISEVWSRVRESKKNANGFILDLKPLGLFVSDPEKEGPAPAGLKPVDNAGLLGVFMALVKQSGPKAWVWFQTRGPWEEVAKNYSGKFGMYPESLVAECANALRNRPYALSGAPMNLEELGIKNEDWLRMLKALLDKRTHKEPGRDAGSANKEGKEKTAAGNTSIDAKGGTGFVLIKSSPPFASITVNGAPKGETPMKDWAEVPTGKCRIVLVHRTAPSFDTTLTITAGSRQQFKFKLED